MSDSNVNVLEIEQKYHIDDVASLEASLIELGALEQSLQQHADTYFNHPSRDFAQTHEALRVRFSNGIPMVTYKGTKLPGAVKARRELEWRLDPGDADGTQMQTLLKLLGFREVATVRKSRRSFSFQQQDSDFTITIDQVESVGLFAEIELVVQVAPDGSDASTEARDALVGETRDKIVKLASQLGLRRDQPRSYLRMLLESRENG